MPTYWTLEYAGNEKTFADWGFDEETPQLDLSNMQTDIFPLGVPGATVEADPIFPFEAQVIIRRHRTSISGGTNSFSGGTIEFSGKRTLHILEGRPDYEGVNYQFAGPWYDLDQTPYLQLVKVYTGDPHALTDAHFSEVVLFQEIAAGDVSPLTNGEQITAILQSLLDQYAAQALTAPFIIGTIAPAVDLPTYEVKDMKCSEAIQLCMRSSPDCTFWFDYTTTPPTANVSRRSTATAVALALADGIQHESIRLTPRYDLQARNVTIVFKQTLSLNGTSWILTTYQQTDASGTATTLIDDTHLTPAKAVGGLRGVIQTVDLQGFSQTNASGNLECVAIANNLAFWKRILPELASDRVRNFTIADAMDVKLDDGVGATNVSLASYPNWLVDGSGIAPWMSVGSTPVAGVKVTIKVHASYDVYDKDAGGNLVTKYLRKELQARITVTNGANGPYSTTLAAEEGDPIPANLSASLYNALAALQYQGAISIVQPEITSEIGIGNVLNLTGGRAEWATMRALVQQITRNYGTGRTTITIGPAAHLSAADLTQIFLVNRFRQVYHNAAAQASAVSSANSSVAFGANAPKENTNQGLPESVLRSVLGAADGAGSKWIIKQDAANGGGALPVIAAQYIKSDGSVDTAKPQLVLDHADLVPSAGQAQPIAKWQQFTDANGHKQYVAATAPVSGNGGGSVQMLKITSVTTADFFTCRTWDGTTLGSTDVYVAKQPNQRPSLLTQDVDLITITYTWTDSNRRIASDTVNTQSEMCYPRYRVDDIIFAATSDHTGVNTGGGLGGITVTMIDLTPRVWARKFGT